MKFRKKPVVIEAVRWTGSNYREITAFCRPLVEKNSTAAEPEIAFQGRNRIAPENNKVLIQTLEGTMTANAGDWIIRGVTGEFYPCRDDIFRATYEPVEESHSAG